MKPNKPRQPAGERARDEKRAHHGPAYGGEAWRAADDRAPSERFGHARNDDVDPLEQVKRGEGDNDDDESVSAADPELAAAEQKQEIQSGGQHVGVRRGEKPKKVKSRSKP